MRKSEDDRKAEIIEALVSARQSILAAVDCMTPEQYDFPCIGVWCVKDLLAHLIGWDETNLQAVQQILAGERPQFFQYYDRDWQSYNAALVSRHRRDSIESLRLNAGESHQRLVSFLRSLTAAQVLTEKSSPENGRPVSILTLLRAETKDERVHAAQVRAFLEKAPAV